MKSQLIIVVMKKMKMEVGSNSNLINWKKKPLKNGQMKERYTKI